MSNLFAKLGAFLTALRVWFFNLLTLAVLIYLVVALGSGFGDSSGGDVDPSGKVLIIAPEGLILDQEIFPADFDPSPFLGAPIDQQHQTRDLVRLLRAAATDERLAAVLVDFSAAFFAGPSTALLLADELALVQAAGKPVVAYSDALGTGAYLLAAQADEIYVHGAGSLSISGLGGYRQYTRELTDKLKITMHNYSQGEFKSAVEGQTRKDMSEADKLQRRELYAPIWEALKQRMASARGVDPQMIQDYADNQSLALLQEGGFDALRHATERGLIDGTMSHPEFRAHMIERFGVDDAAERDTYPHIMYPDYLAQVPEDAGYGDDEVAVVFVQGVIQPGPQGPGVAGSDDVAQLLRQAHESDSTRALVLRVNSPGGSIIASDIIAEEVAAAKRKGLPVFVSMGDVAASGGVWVSLPADQIYAEPTTITGSIGVAVAFPTFENLLDYIGVNYDGVTTSRRADWNVYKPVDDDLDAFFARWASSAYERFIGNVATSRGREPDYIRSIAGGRVWLASRALDLGLVDALGNLEDAVAAAAAAADLDEYQVNYVAPEVPPHILLLRELSRNFTAQVGKQVAAQVGIPMVPRQGAFGRQVARLFEALEDIDRPTATVLCSECMVELQ